MGRGDFRRIISRPGKATLIAFGKLSLAEFGRYLLVATLISLENYGSSATRTSGLGSIWLAYGLTQRIVLLCIATLTPLSQVCCTVTV